MKKVNPTLIATLVLILGLGATYGGWLYNTNLFDEGIKLLPANEAPLISALAEQVSHYVIIGGFLGSVSLFGIILSLASARRRAADLADIMTASLKERTNELEATKNNIEHEKKKLDAILSSMSESLIAVSPEGKIMLLNQSAQATLGAPQTEAYGQKIEEILRLYKDKNTPLPVAEYPIYKVLEQGGIDRLFLHDNAYFKDGYGQLFPVVISAISLSGSKKETEGIAAIVVFRDVSLEKAVDEAKTEFVSLAAHQLRMPLTTVRWYAEMLLSGDAGTVTETQKSYINEIFESNKRMVNLVNQLLSVSRVRLGTFNIDPVPVNLCDVIVGITKEMQPEIDKKKLSFSQTCATDQICNADPELIHAILQNLMSNAIKYTPEGGTISLTVEDTDKLRFKVSDTGYGIPKADQGKIFTQLYRAENIKGKDVDGTGLGLYMVKTIVEQSGGTISFVSEENKGTTFTVEFPKEGMKARQGTKTLS